MRAGRLSAGLPCTVDGCPFREIADGLCIDHFNAAAVEAQRVAAGGAPAPEPEPEDSSPPAPATAGKTKTPKE